MPHGVDTGVHSVQSTARQPQLDCPAAQSGSNELGTADDPVLPLRQLGDAPVQRSFLRFSITVMANRKTVGHGGDRGG